MSAFLADVYAGSRLVPDAGFSCLAEGQPITVQANRAGRLYLPCACGQHFLDGQSDDGVTLVGLRLAVPRLDEFRGVWPKAITENQPRLVAAWDTLSPDERAEAMAGVATYLAARRAAGYLSVPTGARYLSDELWRRAA